ncbi:ABC transporter substrate binding inner membrane protein [Psychromonas ingrahamii 37]|uniref:ABC transporter substrate binding inner membrane protein n=1 Tax=Psychromonas ingrahamii (strain DSM 17664 / CCUG 51855 / 37) TaxID=357804 RepID=A1T044_PSYIN|nr:ABC transporter permease subunit [Psychromonas ingrahamii]ABM05109.1 ABC transporter substrate binding inner membrane protein [Psychromonas ingrahamii 37]
MQYFTGHKWTQFVALLAVFFALVIVIDPATGGNLWRLQETSFWLLPDIVNDGLKFLIDDFWVVEIYDPELDITEESTMIQEFTRGLSGVILFSINLIRELLLGGVKTVVAFTSWEFISANEWARIPALPWPAVAAGAFLIGHYLGGRSLSILAGTSTLYIAVFGQWTPAMQTLSFVLVAVPVSVFLGLTSGILAFKNKSFESILTPLLNVAQSMPHFSYLIPVVVFFGIGDHAGAISTIIFATPPMIRLTILGLKKVSPEVLEAGMMSGCNARQLMFRVLIPTARHDILIGVNQVIMQCLAMAVIASFIGAKGLGYDLLVSLNMLNIGQALELGVSIVLIAVVLDKLSLAWANKQSDYFAELPFHLRHKHSLAFLGILIVTSAIAYAVTVVFPDKANYLYFINDSQGLTTEKFWDFIVDWIITNTYDAVQSFNFFMITSILMPMKEAYLSMPVAATLFLVAGTGYIVGGIRSAIIVTALIAFIALTPWWDQALITAYMTTFAVIISVTIGCSVGILCSRTPRATKVILLVCDTFQTFPSFVYLIPVIMLFGVSDLSVLIAVIVYATIPATRYTVEGLSNVPKSLQEAGSMSGVNRMQRLLKIELPLAFPHIMLGINQTVIFALFMVIIGAFIGTDDLGQLIMQSLSQANAMGQGIVLGLCVAFIGLAVDHLIHTWAEQRKKVLGIA